METIKQNEVVSISLINRAKYNPAIRTKDTVIRPLKDSIATIGQQVPLIVDEDLNLIDGHRRITSLSMNGESEVVARVVKNPDGQVYAELNRLSKPVTRKNWEYTFTVDKSDVPKAYRVSCQKLEDEIGPALFKWLRIEKNRCVFSTVGAAEEVRRYLPDKELADLLVRLVEGKIKRAKMICKDSVTTEGDKSVDLYNLLYAAE